MKIKMAATMLLCSFVMMCSEVNAAGPIGQLLQGADCGCQAAAPDVESCGCEVAVDEGCGCRQPVRGLLSRLRGGCGCGSAAPAPAADCGCEPVAPVVEESCGCQSAAPDCGCRGGSGFRGLLQKMAGQLPGDCGCGPSCEEPVAVVEVPACGCEAAPAPVADCGCDDAPAAAPSCGCQRGGLLGQLRSRSCGCGAAAPAPVADCGCAPEPAPAPVADCGCDDAPAAAPSCGCQSGGLIGRLRSRSCGCGAAAPAPVAADCGCGAAAPAPVAADCGCGAAAPAPDCGCDAAPVASSCGGCGDSSCGGRQLGQRLRVGGCNRCGDSSCNGGCRNRTNGLTLLNRLRGDRIVRDTSNCGRCMPACPNMGCDSGCNTGCNSGCSSCGDAGVVYDHAPTSMGTAPVAQPVAQPVVPAAPTAPAAPAATTEGTIVPSGGSTTRSAQPVVDSAAFVLRTQR